MIQEPKDGAKYWCCKQYAGYEDYNELPMRPWQGGRALRLLPIELYCR